MRFLIHTLFFGFVGLLFLTFLACENNPKKPGYQIDMLSDMVEAVPYESFTPNVNFKDGKTLQDPVSGSIPRGFVPFPYEATPQDAERAGLELVNPVPANTETLTRGKFIYEVFCLQCHGSGGDGDGQLIPKYPNPPSFLADKLIMMKDGQMFHAMTLGKRDMPPHASQIDSVDRWKIIRYVRELQKASKVEKMK
jgi:mono/diheme cytochrome c family protein